MSDLSGIEPGGLSSSAWRSRYGDLSADEVALLGELACSAFLGQGLSDRTARTYAQVVAAGERYCRTRHSTLLAADAGLIGGFAATLTLPRRAQARSALASWWRFLGRASPPLDPLRVAGRQSDLPSKRRSRGHAAGRPHRGDSWDLEGSATSERIRRARESMRRAGVNPTSTRQYCRYLAAAERWCSQRDLDLATIEGEALEQLAETVPRSTSSRRALRSALRHYFHALGRSEPPLWAVRVPKKRRMIARPLEPDELRRLLAVVREDGGRRGFAVMLGLFLGLRRFEIATVRFRDFEGGWLELIGKGDLPARLPVHPEVTRNLARIPKTSAFVFPGRLSGHASPATIWTWVVQLAEEARIDGLTTHRLRHTCLTYANDATKDLRAVQEFARHERPETTAGYTRASADRLLEVMRALGGAYGVTAPRERPGRASSSKWSATLEDIAAGVDGNQYVDDWSALGNLLAGRSGWHLCVESPGPELRFVYEDAPLWVGVDNGWQVNPHRYCLFVELDPDDREVVGCWHFSDIESLGVMLSTFETGDVSALPPTFVLGLSSSGQPDVVAV